MVVLCADLNWHVGIESGGHEGVNGRFGFGTRNAKDESILVWR